MQSIANGIRSIVRTPLKTALFTVLLTGLSVLLCVSFCILGAVTGYLHSAEEYFHTVAEIEFMGEQYPDRTVWDEAVPAAMEAHSEELSRLLSHDAVLGFEPDESCLSIVEGLFRRDGSVYNPKACVLEVSILGFDDQLGVYNAIVSRSLYSVRNMQDKLVQVEFATALDESEVEDLLPTESPSGETGDQGSGVGSSISFDGGGSVIYITGQKVDLETGGHYLIAGWLTSGFSSADLVMAEEISFEDEGSIVTTPFFERTDGIELSDDDPFVRLAKILNVQNNGCRVTYTDSIEDTIPFHLGIMRVKKGGRLFTEEEYASGAKVCIVSSKITGLLDLDVGDKLDMSIYTSKADIYDPSKLLEVDSGEYEIIGIFADVENYPYQIFLPGARSRGFTPVTGYSLGRFLLENRKVSDFLAASAPLTEAGFRVTIYDQGYSAATEPIKELQFISTIFLAVSLLLTLVTLILQSHIFVTRQRETAQTMDKLGAGKRRICVYFISAALIIALVAALLGCVISRLIEGRVFALMQRFATQFAEQDLRFSYTRLAQTRTLEFAPKSGPGVYAAAAGTLLLGTAVFTLCFALSAIKEKRRKRLPKKHAAPVLRGGTSKLSGPLKYSVLSIRRGLVRTLAVLAVCAAAALFFGRLTSSLDGYRAQLEEYKSSAVISCYATDFYGRSADKLLLRPTPMIRLIESGEAERFCATNNIGGCTVLGVGITAEGEKKELDLSLPASEFALESLGMSVMRDRPLVSTPSVERSPQFRSSEPEITWLEGYEDSFSLKYMGPVCAMSETAMREHGIRLGDAVMLLTSQKDARGGLYLGHALFKVAASYISPSTSKTVYIPLTPYLQISGRSPYEDYEIGMDFVPAPEDAERPTLDTNISWQLEGFEEDHGTVEIDGHSYEFTRPERPLSSFTFRLKDNSRIDALRDALAESGYTWVRSGDRLKNYAVIDDAVFLNTTHSMQRQIQYVSALYYSLYGAAFMIGAALAWLLTHSRRQETADMRALGTQRTRIFLNFFCEQALLCAAGVGFGLIVSRLISGAWQTVSLVLCGAFVFIWCASCAIGLIAALRGKQLENLREE